MHTPGEGVVMAVDYMDLITGKQGVEEQRGSER